MGGKKQNINDYQRMLSTYLDRRRKMQIKIDKLRKAIKIRTCRRDKMYLICDVIKDFSGVDLLKISKCSKVRTDIERFALRSFFKYGMDNGIIGSELSLFLGFETKAMASIERMKFVRSFKKDKSSREMYHKLIKICNKRLEQYEESSNKQ